MFTFKEAKEKLGEPYSSLRLVTATKHVILNPKYIGQSSQGVKQQLDQELGLYSERFEGVLIAYSDLKYLNSKGSILDDQPTVHFDIQGQFIIFQPTVGSILKSIINKIGYDHIGGLVHGHFNASVPIPQNKDATDFSLGDEFTFQITKSYHQNGVVFMKGNLIAERTDSSSKKRKRTHSTYDLESPAVRKRSKGMLGCISTPKPDCSVLPFSPGVSMVAQRSACHGGPCESVGSDHTIDSGLGGALSPHHEIPPFSLSEKKHKKKKKHKQDDTELSSNDHDETDNCGKKTKKHKKHKKHKNNDDS